jgi:hypothetical protein
MLPSLAVMPGPPIPPAAYMVDNTNHYFNAAPDHYSPGIGNMLATNETSTRNSAGTLKTVDASTTASPYWLANMAHGQVSF